MTETRPSGIPKLQYTESILFEDYIMSQLGWISSLQAQGKRYLSAENFMKLLDDVTEALSLGMLRNRDENRPTKYGLDSLSIWKIKQIWQGEPAIGIFRDPKTFKIIHRRFYYSKAQIAIDRKRGNFPTEIDYKPSLSELKPARPPTTNPLWREIRANVPWNVGMKNIPLADLALIGGFVDNFANNKKPKFLSRDQMSSPAYVSGYISKHYFDESMKELFKRWTPLKTKLHMQIKQIVIDVKFGNENENYTNTSNADYSEETNQV